MEIFKGKSVYGGIAVGTLQVISNKYVMEIYQIANIHKTHTIATNQKQTDTY